MTMAGPANCSQEQARVPLLFIFSELQTERAAWRDRVISESTAEVWSSAEIEEDMRTAVAQLGEKLQASEVVIRLGTEEQLSN